MRYLLLLWLVWPALAGAAEEPLIDRGWEEAVLSVSDLERMRDFLIEVGGYQLLHEGLVDSTRLAYWELGVESSAREAVLGDPSEERGRIRLLEFRNVEQQQIRYAGQPWDTGGWFSLALWTDDIEAVSRAAQGWHWQAYSEAMEVRGPDGLPVNLMLLRGPDGVTLSLYQPLDPADFEQRDFERLSAPFAISEVVQDLEGSLDFYRTIPDLDASRPREIEDATNGPNPFGLPHNLGAYAEREQHRLQTNAGGPGQQHLIRWRKLQGRDFASRAKAPNLGVLALRYRVRSAAALTGAFTERGATPEAGPVSLVLPPYGIVHLVRLRSPDGAISEFFSVHP